MNIRIIYNNLGAKSITTSYPKLICIALLEMEYLSGKDGMQTLEQILTNIRNTQIE